MPRFNVTVRILDLDAPDRPTARRRMEAQLQAANLGRTQIVTVEPAASPLPVRQPNPPRRPKWLETALGPLLLLGALLWTLWFYWLLFE